MTNVNIKKCTLCDCLLAFIATATVQCVLARQASNHQNSATCVNCAVVHDPQRKVSSI